MARSLLVWTVFLTSILSACIPGTLQLSAPLSGNQSQQTITVFAAASLTEAMTEIGEQFEAQNPHTHVVLNLAGSQQLAQQLAHGAPSDVFASADYEQMQTVIEAQRVAAQDVQPFASNRLIIIFPRNERPIRVLQDLASPGLKIVLADRAVPAGHYTLEFLDNASQDTRLGADYKKAVVANVVSYEENVRAVLSKVILGEADAGIVYTSDVTESNHAQLGWLDIPPALNIVTSYYIAPVSSSNPPEIGQAFIAFVQSPQGQAILIKHGLQAMQDIKP